MAPPDARSGPDSRWQPGLRGGINMSKRKRSTQDFAEEIQAHIEMEIEELRSEGFSEESARLQARQKFGNVRAAEERFYLRGRWVGLDRFLRDLKHGFRSLLA